MGVAAVAATGALLSVVVPSMPDSPWLRNWYQDSVAEPDPGTNPAVVAAIDPFVDIRGSLSAPG